MGLRSAQRQADGKGGAAAHNLLGEQLDGPAFAAKCLAKVLADGAHHRADVVAHVGQRAADALHHGHGLAVEGAAQVAAGEAGLQRNAWPEQ
jgi:hypothetical protein